MHGLSNRTAFPEGGSGRKSPFVRASSDFTLERHSSQNPYRKGLRASLRRPAGRRKPEPRAAAAVAINQDALRIRHGASHDLLRGMVIEAGVSPTVDDPLSPAIPGEKHLAGQEG